ncbi:ABC transporter ATP-binding protein [Pyramidobacter piscolens]|uniref:ABC transporter ATP-binding protein n=1 Tax=Pyramidobacter piscolens TaxID=638849 RepID=UPI001FCC73B9|nr:ABC transporter ATP-binding protein [Pyramidobacter piscolens]BDF78475.1 dipeptide/oligopeptide/nickel ABC transporter ATP-binding protein [Pyramidobacter piscolens]
MDDKLLLQVRHLRTWFKTFKGTVKAVDDVSFDIRQGEVLAVVGESGGGKSVTGFSLIRLIEEPGYIESGEILFDGKDLMKLSEHEMNKLRGKDISMIFQDPMTSLNPVYTIGQQLDETLRLHTGMSRGERRQASVDLLRAVGISNPESRLKNYPHQFSGGMRQRVVIAIALAARPRLIVADEPTTALDVTIQAQILKLMTNLIRAEGSSLMLITHDLAVVSEVADRINVMYCGKIVESGAARDVIDRSAHPYTHGLISSIPDLGTEKERLDTIPGIVPNMFDLPSGCYFSPRCSRAQERCRREAPQLREVAPGHCAACHFPLCGEVK